MVFVLALGARLVPVMRGGTLFGIDTYDDGVHYASALALVHGMVPYRDFLLLHPPGIVVALSPFALIGAATHDGWGFAAARVGWMVMGSTTAVLVCVALRTAGLLGSLVGGVAYAVYLPAIRAERTTMLEGLTSAMLILTILLIGGSQTCPRNPTLRYLGIGAMLGLAASVKIWGVIVAVVVFGWVLRGRGFQQAKLVALGAFLGVAAICLPFYFAAPGAMWRMVVVDQLARPDSAVSLTTRLALIDGLPAEPVADLRPVVAGSVSIALLILIGMFRPLQLPPLLVIAMGAVLLCTPSFYAHYPAALAVPLSLTAGSVAPIVLNWASQFGNWAPKAVGAFTTVALITLTIPVTQLSYGSRIPIAKFSGALADEPGCVTADDPVILVELDVFSRNIARHCPVVVDLTGYQLDLAPGLNVSRTKNAAFQQFALNYLASGRVTAPWRLWNDGYSAQSMRELRRWPVIAEERGRVLLLPPLLLHGE